jgi:hypothetical protein
MIVTIKVGMLKFTLPFSQNHTDPALHTLAMWAVRGSSGRSMPEIAHFQFALNCELA